MQRPAPLVLLAALAGCTAVEVQYSEPAPAGQVDAIAAQAKEGYQYFVLSKGVIVVAPASDIGVGSANQKESPKSGAIADSASLTKGAASASRLSSAKGTTAGGKPSASKEPAKAASAAETKQGSDSDDKSPAPQADNRLARSKIDEVPWAAVVVPTPDNALPMSVRGKSGLWQSTTLTLSRIPNSDRVSAVKVVAKNEFPDRVQQLTAILSSAVAIAGAVAADSGAHPLQAFKLEVPPTSTGKLNLQDGWMYEFTYDASESLAGTISIQDFLRITRGNKVAYWPVPACRSATLTLSRSREKYVFYLTVSSSAHVRLEPLPINGRVDLGEICSASSSGTTTPDPVADAVVNAAALEKLVKTVSSPASQAGK